MKKIITLTLMMAVTVIASAQQKLVGGDLSLVPAYEAAGDVWLDADGKPINTTYSDGMLTYLRDVAKWNAVRVRLIVDANADNAATDNDGLPTCQDIEYVKKFGKRIKDAGMNFMLDIFYSDTWTDVTEQWIPVSWGMNRLTTTTDLAVKVKSYTTEVLNELVAYGATPDYVQIGNEVSYGMLWDSYTTKSNGLHFFNLSNTYTNQKTKIDRFATLLKAAAEGVRASNCSTAKIVLHCERTVNATHSKNFYTYVAQGGFTDYDVIGLSYYPLWHGTLSQLETTLTTLHTAFPAKKIQIVETGYYFTTPQITSKDTNTADTWPYTNAGQGSFIKDLAATLNKYDYVDGLYYWQPEECGNGAGTDGKNRVMGHYDNRGFWELTWKSGNHKLNSKAALMALNNFIGITDDDADDEGGQETEETNLVTNPGFETGTDSGWTFNYTGWGSGPWPATDGYYSSLVTNYAVKAWVGSASSLSAGNIISQTIENVPAGTYIVKCVAHADYDGFYLFANDDQALIPANSQWSEASEVSVNTTLAAAGTITIGLKLTEKPTVSSAVNLYADNFVCATATSGIQAIDADGVSKDNAWYTLDGRRLTEKPNKKGIYIHNNKKAVVR
jgi:arabinogalactan endo-1,4-beta-galactosidase